MNRPDYLRIVRFVMVTGLNAAIDALREDNIEVFRSLIPSQVSPNACFRGTPLLTCAVSCSSLFCLQHLLDQGADLGQFDSSGKSPLHIAVINNRKQALVMLMNAGADPNLPDAEGWTPLHWAVEHRITDFARILYGLDGNPDVPDHEGVTPRMIARELNLTAILDIFAETPEPVSPVFSWCKILSMFCRAA